jgi:hypothetical protein
MLREFEKACQDWQKASELGVSNASKFLLDCN